jgi:hypothetical protein
MIRSGIPIENEELSYLLPMHSILVGVAMLLLVCCAPGNIARSSCESIFLSTRDEWSCTVKGDIVGQASSIAFSTESRNHVAQVSIALRVTKGTLRVGYQDLAGDKHLLVTPSEPADLAVQTRLHRERRSFTLFFEPVGGAVEGLTGTVNYSTP